MRRGRPRHDQTLFALAALLASSLVYNSPGALDEGAIASLGVVSRLAPRKIEADEAGGNSDHLPDLWWVLRDFALELVNADGDEIDSDEYLESSLRRTNRRESDEYRAAIALAFERRRCFCLRPVPGRGRIGSPRRHGQGAAAGLCGRFGGGGGYLVGRGRRRSGALLYAARPLWRSQRRMSTHLMRARRPWSLLLGPQSSRPSDFCAAGRGCRASPPLRRARRVEDDAVPTTHRKRFAAARLEGCRACDGIVAAASNDAVLRSSVGDRPLLDARRRCDHDFAEKLRRRRDRCRRRLLRAPPLRWKRSYAACARRVARHTQRCTPFDDATDAEQAAADAVAATAALQTACGPGDAGFLALAAVRWASENCRALMDRQDRTRDAEAQKATEHITSLRERVAFLEGEQVAMRDAAEEGRKAVASAQTDVQRLTSRCSRPRGRRESKPRGLRKLGERRRLDEGGACGRERDARVRRWQAQLQDRLDATIEEHLEAKRHLVARATRAEEAVSSYSKARRRYTILDLLLESTEDAAARLDANAKELERFLVDLDVPVGALRILRDLGARSVSRPGLRRGVRLRRRRRSDGRPEAPPHRRHRRDEATPREETSEHQRLYY